MPIKFKILMTFLALGALFSVYSLTNSLKSNINATIPRALSVNLPSGLEEDADHDGLSNTAESYWATEWQNSDTDGDGLSDRMELNFHTDLTNPDTDGDGYEDGAEISSGYDPLNPAKAKLIKKIEINTGKEQKLYYFLVL